MPQRRPLAESLTGATIGPLPVPVTPLPPSPDDEFLRRMTSIGDILNALGFGELDGATPGPVTAGAKVIGLASRVPGWTRRAPRIPRGGQAALDPMQKIQRFRSPAGDFVRYQGRWLRLKPFAADATHVTLEDLGPGVRKVTDPVLETVTVPVKQFYESITDANAARLAAAKAAKATGAKGRK